MVFYLKYRPRRISELDSIAIQERLTSVLKGNLPDKIPHAFLFTGSKGLGKTSVARIVAKSINCTNRKPNEIEPCNKCSSCKSIDNGSNLDVLEIDGASNRGIDEIRDLREKIKLSPLNSKKKVYIIDEVHMLTTEAFNALLKTLEEPPSHAQFMFCTTEPQKLPDTILSRCFNIQFGRATEEDLVHSFSRIVKGEGIKADKEALFEIATLSDGSFRDGAKILEEISIGSRKITAQAVEKKFNYKNINKATTDLIKALREKNAKRSVEIISKLSNENTDFKLFTEKLINTLHANFISEIEDGLGSAKETKEMISVIIDAHSRIKYAVLPQLPLEMAVVEWCAHEKEVLKNDSDQERQNEEPDKNIEIKSTKSINTSSNDKILDKLIENVKKDNFSIAGVLRGCQIEKNDKKNFILSTEYKFHKERLSDRKVVEMLEKNIENITGDKKQVSIELRG